MHGDRAGCEGLLERKAFSARGLHLGYLDFSVFVPALAGRFKKRTCHRAEAA